MKTKTTNLKTGITTVQKKQSNGVVRIVINDSQSQPKLTKTEKWLVAPLGVLALFCIATASIKIYSSLSLTALLALSPVIFFTWAVFTAIVINLYLLIFKS